MKKIYKFHNFDLSKSMDQRKIDECLKEKKNSRRKSFFGIKKSQPSHHTQKQNVNKLQAQ